MATLFKELLQEKHVQTYELFRAEYMKVGRKLNQQAAAPSRAQFHRWMAGNLKGLPHARHCRILASMFPDRKVELLFLERDEKTDDEESNTLELNESSAPALQGSIVEIFTGISIVIEPDGSAVVSYDEEILNLTDGPVSRVSKDIWFEQVSPERLKIQAVEHPPHSVLIQRIHDSPNMSKFACQIMPPLQPGESAKFGCVCTGGAFVDNHYWRQSFWRFTREFKISVVQKGKALRGCLAIEEGANGSETLATEKVVWGQHDSFTSLDLSISSLEPGQTVTIRWDVEDVA